MSESVRPFNIMAKPVCGVCNLRCEYCYYSNKPQRLYGGVERFMMKDETLESFVRQYMQAQPQRADFAWQGGEPLLAGKEFFRKATELQKQHKQPEQVVSNSIQTNGTLLDDEWCEMFAQGGFLVGISLDGPPQWHDAFRRDYAGQPTFHKAWAGLELLRRHRVESNVLVTLNSMNVPHAGDVYRYFVNRGVRYLQFIPVLERKADGGVEDYSCTGEQFGRFMLEVFDLWASRDVGQVSERLIDSVLHKLIYDRPSTCCYAERCANAMVLEFNGDLYACDHFVFPEWKLGNITETPLAELAAGEVLQRFAMLKSDPPAACRECEFLNFCRGGCPKHHAPIAGGPERVNHFCEGYKLFFREALPELKRMAECICRGETPPKRPQGAYVPSAAAAQPVRNGPPGRNEHCPCGSGKKFKNCCGKEE